MMCRTTLLLCAMVLVASCSTSRESKKKKISGPEETEQMDSIKTIPYTVSVREVNQSTSRPALESFVAGRDGNQVLFIGGRISGFHGVGDADGFHSSNSNSSFVVIDFETGNSWSHPVSEKYLQQGSLEAFTNG